MTSQINPHIYILSYNRPHRIKTLKALQKIGNTYPYYIVVSTDDPQLETYKKQYKKQLLIFDKDKIQVNYVAGNKIKSIPLYARIYIQKHAKQNNITNIIMLDDDYSRFCIRYNNDGHLKQKVNLPWTQITKEIFKIIQHNPHTYLAFSQNGDYIGGINNELIKQGFKYKIMNTFFINTKLQYIPFQATLNEDSVAGLKLGMTGNAPITIGRLSLDQEDTQQEKGGLTDAYLQEGTYTKSFFNIITNPSATKIIQMTGAKKGYKKHYRYHHTIQKNKAYPKIIRETNK